jgi:HEAT repeat protein
MVRPHVSLAFLIGMVVVGSGGAMAGEADVAKLMNDLRDSATQTQASLALVDIGLPAVRPLIDGVCTKGLEAWSRDTLLRLVLQCHDKGGPAKDRTKIAVVLIDTVTNDKRPEARGVAVRMLGHIGRDEAVPALALALQDKGLREDAIASLQEIPGVSASEALIRFAETANSEDRCSVLQSLGLRGDAASVAYLTQAAKDSDVNVQIAAVEGLGQAGDGSAAPLVQTIAESGADQIRPVAMRAYLRLAEAACRAGKRDEALAMYDKAMAMSKQQLNRFAAIAGFARVAGKAGADRLIGALGKMGTDADRQIISELSRMPGAAVTQAVAEACKGAAPSVKTKLLTILGIRRDPVGFATLLSAAKDGDEGVRGVAIYAMATTGNAGMDGAIVEGLYKGTPRVQAAAADAYILVAQRLLREDRAKNETKVLKVYEDILAKKVEPATTVAALRGIAMIANPTSASGVERFLDGGDPTVRAAAAEAYLAIAARLDGKKDRDRALAMYNRLIDSNAVPPGEMSTVLGRLRELGDTSDIAGKLGMITNWWVVGPWPSPDYAAFDKVFFPENHVDLAKTTTDAGSPMAWKPIVTTNPEGRVDLNAQFKDNQNKVAYGYAEVTSDEDQDVIFRTGSDDGMKLWVNGKQVFAKSGPRSLAVDMDAFPVRLNKGVNRILIKVLNGGGAWEFCVRATDKQGRPIKLRVRPAK